MGELWWDGMVRRMRTLRLATVCCFASEIERSVPCIPRMRYRVFNELEFSIVTPEYGPKEFYREKSFSEFSNGR